MKQTDWQVKCRIALFRCSLRMTANADAHRETTAVEIMESFDGQLDALVLTAGTGGTVTGTGEELKKRITEFKNLCSRASRITRPIRRRTRST